MPLLSRYLRVANKISHFQKLHRLAERPGKRHYAALDDQYLLPLFAAVGPAPAHPGRVIRAAAGGWHRAGHGVSEDDGRLRPVGGPAGVPVGLAAGEPAPRRRRSLTLTASATPPEDDDLRTNWLPAPAGPFSLFLRAYRPERPILDGTWTPPLVIRFG